MKTITVNDDNSIHSYPKMKRPYSILLLCALLLFLVLYLPFPEMTSMGQTEAMTASPPEADMEREITRIILPPYTDVLLLAETRSAEDTRCV